MENVSDAARAIEAEPTGTWMVPVSLRERWMKLVWRFGIASALTTWLFYLQFQNNAPVPYMMWGFGIFAVGTFLGVRAFGIRERRIFDTSEIHYTHAQRVKRAARWFLPGLVMLGFVWWVQLSSDQFSTYWWYAWPALFPLWVGAGLYMLKRERVLSATGQYARAQLEEAKLRTSEARKAKLHSACMGVIAAIVYLGACFFLCWAGAIVAMQCLGWLNAGEWQPVPAHAVMLSPEGQAGLKFYEARVQALDLVPSWGSSAEPEEVAHAIAPRMIGARKMVQWLLDLPFALVLVVAAMVAGLVSIAAAEDRRRP